jgi:hypothetical protein
MREEDRADAVVHDVSSESVIKSEAEESDAESATLRWLNRRSLAETTTQSNVRSMSVVVSAMSTPETCDPKPFRRPQCASGLQRTVAVPAFRGRRTRVGAPAFRGRRTRSARVVKSLATWVTQISAQPIEVAQMEELPTESQQIESRRFA